MATLPDFLMAGGSEEEWAQRHAAAGTDAAAPLPLLAALLEEPPSDDDHEPELLLDKPAEEEANEQQEAQADAAADADDDDDGDSSSAADEESAAAASAAPAPTSRPPSLLGPLVSSEKNPALLDEEELCVGGAAAAAAGLGPAAAADGEELVEFEILIDGEVVGSTFLPKPRNEAEAALSDEAAAKAIKDARRRKFEERMGIAPGASSAAVATAASSGPFVPQPPALCNSCQKQNAKYKCPKCDTGSGSTTTGHKHASHVSATALRSPRLILICPRESVCL